MGVCNDKWLCEQYIVKKLKEPLFFLISHIFNSPVKSILTFTNIMKP